MELDVDDILNEKDLMVEVSVIYADMISREIKKLKDSFKGEKEPVEQIMSIMVKIFMAFYRNGLTLEKSCVNMYGVDKYSIELLKLNAEKITDNVINKEVEKRKAYKTSGVF